MRLTEGMLALQIARLELDLELLEKQQVLSKPYPEHTARLSEKRVQIQSQLHQLFQLRSTHLQHDFRDDPKKRNHE